MRTPAAKKVNTTSPWYIQYRNYGEEQLRRVYCPDFQSGWETVNDMNRDDKTAWISLRKNPNYIGRENATNE